MIARELTEFFRSFSPDGTPVVQRVDGPVFLSNVNASYARSCWAEIRFPDVEYAEDQAFSRAMLDAGWLKVFHPGAAVLHAHDYSQGEFMRRYFDEYRGLRETIGHVEDMSPRTVARRHPPPGGRGPALDARAGLAAGAARALGGALRGASRRAAGLRRSRLALRAAARPAAP